MPSPHSPLGPQSEPLPGVPPVELRAHFRLACLRGQVAGRLLLRHAVQRRFPLLTPRDMMRVQKLFLEALGIDRELAHPGRAGVRAVLPRARVRRDLRIEGRQVEVDAGVVENEFTRAATSSLIRKQPGRLLPPCPRRAKSS